MVIFYMLAGIGILVVALGFYIWFKQAIFLVSRHANVKSEDVAPFAKLNGLCTVGFGTGLLFSGICGIMNLLVAGNIIAVICFIAAIILYFYAQIKYNSAV